jgi:hypothetical protein
MKTLLRLSILWVGMFFCFASPAQDCVFKKELSSEWLQYVEEQFIPFDGQTAANVAYLKIKNSASEGGFLGVSSTSSLSVFVNNRLIATGSSFMLNLDSLATRYSSNDLVFAFYSKQKISHETLRTGLCFPGTYNREVGYEEHGFHFYFRDFVILGMLLLMMLVVAMIRLNPKLASDYFSVAKIFSFREGDESQLYTRIGSSTNILFYVYCSLLVGYYLFVLFHFLPDTYHTALNFVATGFWEAVLQWLKLSSIVFLLLCMKILLLFGFSYLFGMPEAGGIHFFNWVRLLVVFFGILSAVLFVYYIWHGRDQTLLVYMFRLVAWITAAWIILIFLKLAGKVNGSMFHLFSYICATELIPFLFIAKVLYN